MMKSDDEWTCSCCGAPAHVKWRSWEFDQPVIVARCEKHTNSNPCAMPGCKRTRRSKYRSETNYLCGDHWRQVCPPHSRLRRTYRRFFRLAKKFTGGDTTKRWPEDLERRYWRFWFGLVRRARAEIGPPMDIDEINKMFGWDV